MVEIGVILPGKQLGYKDNNPHIYQACEMCGLERWVGIKKGKPVSTHCRRCGIIVNAKRYKEHYNYKGGRVICKDGYILILLEPNNPYNKNTREWDIYNQSQQDMVAQDWKKTRKVVLE